MIKLSFSGEPETNKDELLIQLVDIINASDEEELLNLFYAPCDNFFSMFMNNHVPYSNKDNCNNGNGCDKETCTKYNICENRNITDTEWLSLKADKEYWNKINVKNEFKDYVERYGSCAL